MILDNEQKQIFINFIDTFKDVVRDKRHKFIATHYADGSTVIGHPLKSGSELNISKIDFEALSRSKLFDGYYLDSPHNMEFIITLEALKYYEIVKNEKFAPLQRIENETMNYIKSKYFSEKFPKAYQKWHDAEELYLKETKNKNLTTIGHLYRESLQEFSDELLFHKSITKAFPKSNIIAKIRCVFQASNNQSKTTIQFLDSLLNY